MKTNNNASEVVNAMHKAIDSLESQLSNNLMPMSIGRDVKTVSLYKVNNNGQQTIAAVARVSLTFSATIAVEDSKY